MGSGNNRESHGFEAPEVDLAVQAPEFHRRVPDGLQVQNGAEPELLRSREPGIVVDEQGLLEVARKEHPQAKGGRSINATCSHLIWLAVASITLVVAVALGVGLGVGLQKRRSNAMPSNSTSSTFTRRAVNDTSLAAVTTPDGNRHVFLQDINGTLRHAVFSSVENLWLSNVDYLIPLEPVSPPRLGTPITATYPAGQNPSYILVYYVNVKNSLSAINYSILSAGIRYGDAFNGSVAIMPGSRCLTAAAVEGSANDGLPIAFLFFQDPSGNISFLYGRFTREEWEWQTMSEVLDAALREDLDDEKSSLGCPCTSSKSSPTTVQATFFNPEFLANASAPLAISMNFLNATEADNIYNIRPSSEDSASFETLSSELGISGILNSIDIMEPDYSTEASGGAWLVVNETLQALDFTNPKSKFPFGRLAWLTSNTSSLYIYHQMDESTLAEEEYINGAGWNTRLITISTS